jgi:hypothetical protein
MLPDTGIDDVKKQRNAKYAKHINDPVLSSLKMEGICLLFSVCHCQYHSTNAPNPLHLSTVLYQNDKRKKTGKLQTKQYPFGYLRSIANESTFTLLLSFKGLGYVKSITMDSYKNTVFA